MNRVKTIPIQHFCIRSCSHCSAFRLLRKESISVERFKALVEGIDPNRTDTVRLPCSVTEHPELNSIIATVLSAGLELELLFHWNSSLDLLKDQLANLPPEFLEKVRLAVVLNMEHEAGELDRIFAIDSLGVETNFVLIPLQSSDISKRVCSLPGFIVDRVKFAFPLKGSSDDEFLSPDEVYLSLREVQKQVKGFTPEALPYLYETFSVGTERNELQKVLFLQTLDGRFFQDHIEGMGKFGGLRSLFTFWTKNRWLWPVRVLMFPLLALVWLFVDPKRSGVVAYWAVERTCTFLVWTTYPALCAMEATLVSFYWLLRRVRDFFHRLGISSFWYSWKQGSRIFEGGQVLFWSFWRLGSCVYAQYLVLFEHGRSGFWWLWRQASKIYERGQYVYWRHLWVWASRKYEGFLDFFWGKLWQQIYPLRKVYYFASFQIRSRVLRFRSK